MNYIYCDESCYLKNDNLDIMILGGILCPKAQKNIINKKIEQLKLSHGLRSNSEIKWTKVSKKYMSLYKEILDFVFSNYDMKIGIIIVKNKHLINHEKYNQTHDEWYSKMYYFLLSNKFFINKKFKSENKVFVDIKDTKGGKRIKSLHDYLKKRDIKKGYYRKYIGIYQINSKESNILQALDLILGILGYYTGFRQLKEDSPKIELIEYFTSKQFINYDKNRRVNGSKVFRIVTFDLKGGVDNE